jgi:hypothetical protein
MMKTARTAALLFLGIGLTLNGYSQAESLVAAYTFSGNANDVTGNGFNGSVQGATLTADRFGNPNSAYYFDGASAYITTPVNSTAFSGNFSVSLWFNAYDFTNSWPTLLLEQNDSLLMGLVGQTSGTLEPDHIGDFVTYSSYAPATFSWFLERYQQTPLGTSINVFLTKSGSDVVMYWNGQAVVSGQVASPITQPGSFLSIGRSIGNETVEGNSAFHGVIDDIRIYNRGLTPEEVTGLYQLEAVPEPSALSFVGIALVGWLFIRRQS